MQYLDAIAKMTEWSLFPRQIIQNHSNPNPCPNHSCWRSWSWSVLWRPRTNTKKRCSIHHWGLECQSRKSRDTWSNRQVWPRRTKWSSTKTNRILPENVLVIASTLSQQHKRWLYTWTSPNGQYQNQIDYIRVAEDGEAVYSQQKQDLELTVAQTIRFSWQNSSLTKESRENH